MSQKGFYGVHPLAFARHRRHVRGRGPTPRRFDFLASVAGAMLFLSFCAYGLRLVGQRHVNEAGSQDLTPSVRQAPWTTDALSEAFREILGIRTAYAATVPIPKYWGAPIAKTVTLAAAPGQEVPVELLFKNTGSAAWTPTGRAYVSAYTTQPRYHASVFRSPGWIASYRPARLAETRVATGETGTIRFTIKAPAKAGNYTDTFQLAAEDTSWIWGAFTTIKLTVQPPAAASAVRAPDVKAPDTKAPEPPATLAGSLVFSSAERIEAPGGLQMSVRAVFKNEGTAEWKRYGVRLTSMKAPAGASDQQAADASWASPEIPVVVNGVVAARQNADVMFSLTTPRKAGAYIYRFVLFSGDATLESAPFVLPVTVTSDAQAPVPQSEVETGPQGAPPAPPVVASGEPIIRVGLFTTDKREEIGSDGPFEVRNAEGVTLARFAAGTFTQFWYDPGLRAYRVFGAGADIASPTPIRFHQSGSAAAFTITSYEHRPAWNTSLNDNRFRGAIELRKNDKNEYVWLINELPFEQYLRGLGETSNASPLEFQKALAVAARTYAYWHWSNPGKHWHFTVDATYDQVYLGYGAELRLPRWVSAIEATRGQVVTYEDKPIVTPYFTWSDGRTRAWTEVWGGSHKPWLVSVPAVYDAAAGRTLFGHGVGMSAWDAIGKANAGQTYDVILRYYYTGTGLKTAY